MPHGDADKGIHTPKSTFYDQGRFGRLFPALPGFAAQITSVTDDTVSVAARDPEAES